MKIDAEYIEKYKDFKFKTLDTETKQVTYWRCIPCPSCGKWLCDNPRFHHCPYCGVELERDGGK